VRHLTLEDPQPGPPLPLLGAVGAALSRIAGMQGLPVADLDAVRVLGPAEGSVDAGAAAVDRLVDSGTRLVVVEGADTVPALVVVSVLLDLEPVAALGTAPSPDWADRLAALRDGLAAGRRHVSDPERLLRESGEEGFLAGAVAQAAARRTPVLLDGSAQAAAALLVADRLAARCASWVVAGSRPWTPGAQAALADLAVEPLLDLGLRERGAALALALLREAAAGAASTRGATGARRRGRSATGGATRTPRA
jgi:nicotinate-nucleotide--dimethylbenzimidazole phosphoribosyltransferase